MGGTRREFWETKKKSGGPKTPKSGEGVQHERDAMILAITETVWTENDPPFKRGGMTLGEKKRYGRYAAGHKNVFADGRRRISGAGDRNTAKSTTNGPEKINCFLGNRASPGLAI